MEAAKLNIGPDLGLPNTSLVAVFSKLPVENPGKSLLLELLKFFNVACFEKGSYLTQATETLDIYRPLP